MSIKLFYKSYGEGEPLIILHGLLGASGNWHTLSRNVFADRFQVFTLDLRNHGRSPHSDIFDYPSMVGDLERFIEERDLAPANVLGHSMGGKVAMWLALEHPDLVRRLIVADIAPRAYPPHHMHILNALKALDLPAFTSRAEVDEALAEQIKEPAIRQFLLKNLDSNEGSDYRWKMNLPAIYENYPRINSAIESSRVYDGPALFIKGGRSNYIAEKDEAQIKSLFPEAKMQQIPDAGHWIHAEAPQRFAEMVLAFTG